MGSSSANISSRTSPPFFSTMRMKSIFYTLLLVSPACLALDLQHATPQQSSVGRQFSDDEIVNYSVWGFIAGLMDYFIRQQFSTTTSTAVRATAVVDAEGDVADTEAEEDDAVVEVADAMVEQVKKVRNKKKQKKNKKNRNKNTMKKKEMQKMMPIEKQMEEDNLDDATVNV